MSDMVNCESCGRDETTLVREVVGEPSFIGIFTDCSNCGSLSLLEYQSDRTYDLDLQLDVAMGSIDLASEQANLGALVHELKDELRQLTGHYVN